MELRNLLDATRTTLIDTAAHAFKMVIQAGTAVVGKVRLVTANGDEVTEDTGDTVKTSIASGGIASGAVASGAIASGAMVAGSQADGHSATLGLTTTDAAGTGTVEDTTARTAIGLLKGNKNLLKLINDKMVTGTDIGDVTINNANAAAAVNIQDGGNTITVDGTVAVTAAQLPSALGIGTMAQGMKVVPPNDLTDAIYIGDIKFGESLPAGEAHVGMVGGQKVRVSKSFTRPANTTAYTAKDVVGVNLTVSDATNASPIVMTTGTHGLADRDYVTIASVGGNTNANGNRYAKVTGYSGTTFGLYSDQALTTPIAGNGAYTSGGTVAVILTFANIARLASSGGYIIRVTVLEGATAVIDSFRLHLYNSPPAAILDNAACTSPLYADAGSYVGTIGVPVLAAEGSGGASYANATSNTGASNLPMAFVTSLVAHLYGVLESVSGHTPGSGDTYTVVLVAEID